MDKKLSKVHDTIKRWHKKKLLSHYRDVKSIIMRRIWNKN